MPQADREAKLKKDIQRIIKELESLQKDRVEAEEDREEIGEDVDKIAEDVEDIKQGVKESGEDVDEIKEDVEEIKKEIDDTGEDVDEIKENVEEIKKEVDETGEDVEEIKEDIEHIKKNITVLTKEATKKQGLFSRVGKKILPSKFDTKDIAQQIVGATILSAPFSVTEEVWNLANNLTAFNIMALLAITILFDILLYYYARFQHLEEKRAILFPVRVLSLLAVTYLTSTIVLTTFGVIGGHIQDPVWAMKLIIMVGLFANIGAGTADLIK